MSKTSHIKPAPKKNLRKQAARTRAAEPATGRPDATRPDAARLCRAALAAAILSGACGAPLLTGVAWAQSSPAASPIPGTGATFDRRQPVTFQADRIDYNQKTNIVTLSGHVEAWQAGPRIDSADRVLYDRNTNIADAIGHVVLVLARTARSSIRTMPSSART